MHVFLVLVLALSAAFVAPPPPPPVAPCPADFQQVPPIVAPAKADVSELSMCRKALTYWIFNDSDYEIWLVQSGTNLDRIVPAKQEPFRAALASLGISGYPIFPFQRSQFRSAGTPKLTLAPVEVHAAWRQWEKAVAVQQAVPSNGAEVIKTYVKAQQNLPPSPPRDLWPPKAGDWNRAIEWICLHTPRWPC